jgi:hypothetical protein
MIFLRTLICHSIKIDHCPREEIAGSAEKAGNSSEIVVLQGKYKAYFL